jgi:thymidylate kinase
VVKIKQIMLCGNDRSGKTSIARYIAKKLNWPIIKINTGQYVREGVPIGSNELERLMKVFNETVWQFKDSNFILDRGFISTLVYSKVYERTYDTNYILDLMETECDNLLVVHVYTPPELILKKLGEDKHNVIEAKNIPLLDAEYKRFFNTKYWDDKKEDGKFMRIDNYYDRDIKDLGDEIIAKVNAQH